MNFLVFFFAWVILLTFLSLVCTIAIFTLSYKSVEGHKRQQLQQRHSYTEIKVNKSLLVRHQVSKWTQFQNWIWFIVFSVSEAEIKTVDVCKATVKIPCLEISHYKAANYLYSSHKSVKHHVSLITEINAAGVGCVLNGVYVECRWILPNLLCYETQQHSSTMTNCTFLGGY